MCKILSFDVGMRNLSFCMIEYSYAPVATHEDVATTKHPWSNFCVLHWEVLDILDEKSSNAKTINIHKVSQQLMDVLNSRLHLVQNHDIDYICVEQQPMGGFGNKKNSGSVRMKLMQHVILNFYELYYRWHSRSKIPEITSISAGNKLKCVLDSQNMVTEPLSKTLDLPYKQRKQKAVEYCSQIMQWIQPVPEEAKALWDERKKQDDLADCFMQAVYVIQTTMPIPKKKRVCKEKVATSKRAKKSDE